MKQDEANHLEHLGSQQTTYIYEKPSVKMLETFPNQYPENSYQIDVEFPEFTSLCPKTGQPDFATIHIQYVPDKKCIETKSLKLYFFAFRNHGSFMETIVNSIMEDLVEVLDPKYILVKGAYNPRGGIRLEPIAVYTKPGYETH